MDVKALFQILAQKAREQAKEAGEACDVPTCNSLTLGVRCDKCGRRLCNGHAVWTFTAGMPPKAESFCPYCLLSIFRDIFSDDGGGV